MDSALDFESCGLWKRLYFSDVFPEARRIGLFEWYYNSTGADVDFHDGVLLMLTVHCVFVHGMRNPY